MLGRGVCPELKPTKQIDLDNRVAALLVSEHDAHLRTLENLLPCDIHRSNQLTLTGRRMRWSAKPCG